MSGCDLALPGVIMVGMTRRELLTTTQLAAILGVTRQAVLARVRRGTLKPYRTLANGHHLFKAGQGS